MRHGSLRVALTGLLVCVASCWLLMSSPVSAAPTGWVEHRVAGVVFSTPEVAEVTVQELPESVTVVAVTHRDEVLLLTLYRGKSAPSAKQAVAAHGEEFERRVSKNGPLRVGRDNAMMLGRKRTVRTLEHGPEDMRERTSVVAVRLTKTTIVAAWTAPEASRRTVSSAVVKGLTFE